MPFWSLASVSIKARAVQWQLAVLQIYIVSVTYTAARIGEREGNGCHSLAGRSAHVRCTPLSFVARHTGLFIREGRPAVPNTPCALVITNWNCVSWHPAWASSRVWSFGRWHIDMTCLMLHAICDRLAWWGDRKCSLVAAASVSGCCFLCFPDRHRSDFSERDAAFLRLIKRVCCPSRVVAECEQWHPSALPFTNCNVSTIKINNGYTKLPPFQNYTWFPILIVKLGYTVRTYMHLQVLACLNNSSLKFAKNQYKGQFDQTSVYLQKISPLSSVYLKRWASPGGQWAIAQI